jgi:RHS repeat-associated protein
VVRTGATTSYYFEIPDIRGTSTLYLDNTADNAATSTPVWRQFTPYGAPRGTGSTWIDNRAYLNKPADTVTGLTDLGARQYDPVTGQFISPDPILKPGDPQDFSPYVYSENNPVTYSDLNGTCAAMGDAICPGATKQEIAHEAAQQQKLIDAGDFNYQPAYYAAGDYLIAAPSRSALDKVLRAAQHQIGNGYGVYWEGELGYSVTGDDPGVLVAIAQAACASNPGYCLSQPPPCTSFWCQVKNVLGAMAMTGMVSSDDGGTMPSMNAALGAMFKERGEGFENNVLDQLEPGVTRNSEKTGGTVLVTESRLPAIAYGRQPHIRLR